MRRSTDHRMEEEMTEIQILERRVGRILEIFATREIKLPDYPDSIFEIEELRDGNAEYEDYMLQLLARNYKPWGQGPIANSPYYKIIQMKSEFNPKKKLVGVVQQSIVDSICTSKLLPHGQRVKFIRGLDERATAAAVPVGTEAIVVVYWDDEDADNEIGVERRKYNVPHGKTAVKILSTDLGYVESDDPDRQLITYFVWTADLQAI